MIATNSHEKDSVAGPGASDNERMVRAIEAGDPQAERTLVERYLGPVRAMLLARSRNIDTASDLLQGVMVEVICALRRGQLEDRDQLPAFVADIVREALNVHFRGGRGSAAPELPDGLPDLSFTQGRLQEEQRAERAAEALASLDPLDRGILQMTLIDGMKPAGIAERLKMRSDVVRQRKLRAVRKVIEMVRAESQNKPPADMEAGKTP